MRLAGIRIVVQAFVVPALAENARTYEPLRPSRETKTSRGMVSLFPPFGNRKGWGTLICGGVNEYKNDGLPPLAITGRGAPAFGRAGTSRSRSLPGAPCLAVFETLRLPPRLRSGLRLTTTGYRYHGLMHPRSTAAFLLGFQSMYPLLDNREKWATPFPIVFNGALTECPRSSQVAPPFALFKGWGEPSYRASRVEERPFMPALSEAEEAA